MKSAMLFAGIGLGALLLAACENKAEEQLEQKAEQAMKLDDKPKDTDKDEQGSNQRK